MRISKNLWGVAGATVVLGLAAGTFLGTQQSGGTDSTDVVIASGDARLPSESATDWVTYGDHVAVVRLSEEEKLPVSEEDQANGEGYVGRSVTMTVQDVLWTRDAAPELPASVSFQADGWVMKDGKQTPTALHDTPRLEKGHTYILALSRFSDGWAPTGTGAMLPYDDRTIGKGESEGRTQTLAEARTAASAHADGEDDVEHSLLGRPAAALVPVLKAAEPDPAAEPYRELDPETRWMKASGRTEE